MKINRQKYMIARAKACMGQKELIAAGIPKGTLCHIVSGSAARPETIGKIAKALGVDVTEIIEEENNMLPGMGLKWKGDQMSKQVYTAKDLQELLGVSESKAYQYIRTMNAELQESGFLTVRGKVPVAYVEKRFFGVVNDGEQNRVAG